MAIVTQGPQSSQPSRRELRSRASQQTQEVIRYSPDPPSAQPPKRAARSQPAKKVVTHAPREGAAKKKAGGNRGPSTQFQEDDDEEETGEGEEEEEVEAMRIEEEIQNTRRTRSSESRNSNVKLARIQFEMAKLLEAASNLPGGYQAIKQVVERNRAVLEEEIQIEPLESAEGEGEAEDEESEGEEDAGHAQKGGEVEEEALVVEEEEEPAEPLRHIRKEPLQRKKRNPWSPDEERFLITAINKHGAKWSFIEAKYAHKELYGRNQTALKDKARNIMRRIIDCGNEEIWLNKYPKWAEVHVGPARRGVHDYARYPNRVPPEKELQKKLERFGEESEDDTDSGY